jgi:peptide/nickel transport system ATP-binding protein
MILDIENLQISFDQKTVVKSFSLKLENSKILGIVGESGSGKSLSVLSILGILPKTANLRYDKMEFNGQRINPKNNKKIKAIRGKEISMIFQEPMSSLNPSMACGQQVAEILLCHNLADGKTVKSQVVSLFDKVRLPRPTEVYDKYPHQISGGQKQRVMIAMAIACRPKLLIADEPTTALDVSVQKEIIELLKTLQQETEMSIIFISHDLAIVKNIADEIMVMYKGQIIEKQTSHDIFNNPEQNYTKALISARPQTGVRLKRLPTISDFSDHDFHVEKEDHKNRIEKHEIMYASPPILEVKQLNKQFKLNSSILSHPTYFKAIDNVSLDVFEGEKLGVVGESGCGKTTLGHLITGLLSPDSGQIYYKKNDITGLSKKQHNSIKKEIQIIFQDPYSSLNPRISIGDAIAEPMKVHKLVSSGKERRKEVEKLLESVGLSKEHYNRYPHEFSGGQRQRIGIARCLALKPKVIICDESVSALDISVQAQVLNLLEDLKEEFKLTYIFISHDLSVVRQFSDRILVMKNGRIVEEGEADSLYENPSEEYTQKLIEAIPH